MLQLEWPCFWGLGHSEVAMEWGLTILLLNNAKALSNARVNLHSMISVIKPTRNIAKNLAQGVAF